MALEAFAKLLEATTTQKEGVLLLFVLSTSEMSLSSSPSLCHLLTCLPVVLHPTPGQCQERRRPGSSQRLLVATIGPFPTTSPILSAWHQQHPALLVRAAAHKSSMQLREARAEISPGQKTRMFADDFQSFHSF